MVPACNGTAVRRNLFARAFILMRRNGHPQGVAAGWMRNRRTNTMRRDRRDSVSALVRRQDRDRYWATHLAPAPQRVHLFALYAFNIELARVAELVREPRLGEIRLQWWRDALESEAGGHPVAEAFAETRAACDLPEERIAAMIDARSFDVWRDPMPDMAALRRYLEATAGAVFALAAWIAGARSEAVAEAATHAGVVYGLTGLMRALPVHAARGQVFLPADVLGARGIGADEIVRGEDSETLRAALATLRDIAGTELAAFRERFAALPATALPAFLPLVLSGPYLRKLAGPGHRPLHEIADINPLSRLWLIWQAHLRGRVV